MKKDKETQERDKSEGELELKRYKDLLSMREKEINALKADQSKQKAMEEAASRRVEQLERENKELSNTLLKKQRGMSPFKGQSRSQYQMIDDLQDAIMAKGPIAEEDLRNNYN